MAKDLVIPDLINTGGTAWVQGSLPATAGIVVISCTSSLYVGYSDTEPTSHIIVLNGANMPFSISVADMSKVWVKTYGGSNLVSTAYYPSGFGPVPG